MIPVKYVGGKWCWLLQEDTTIETKILGQTVTHEYFSLTPDGLLTVRNQYAWNGPTGIPRFLQCTLFFNMVWASLFHDALYQAIELDLLSNKYRNEADDLLLSIWKDSGVSPIIANSGYLLVRLFGGHFV